MSASGSASGSAFGRDATGRAPSRLRAEVSHLKLLDVATVVFFAALTIAAIVTSRQDVAELDKYSQAISSGALGIIALGSIIFGHPFTVDYAKEEAPPEAWHTAAFKRINLVLDEDTTVQKRFCRPLDRRPMLADQSFGLFPQLTEQAVYSASRS